MSCWTKIEGKVISRKLSIKKIIDATLKGEDYIGKFKSDNEFEVHYEQDGFDAVNSLKKIIESIKSRDPKARTTIEFYTTFDQ